MRRLRVGDVVLAEFPYTDKEERKLRPIVVIAMVGQFVWGVMLTSSIQFYNEHTYQLNKSDVDFVLSKTTIARCDVVQTIDLKICKNLIGKLNIDCKDRILEMVYKIIGKAQ